MFHVVLAAVLSHPAPSGEQRNCAHEAASRHSGGVRDLGYFFSPQNYGDAAHGRALSTTSWSPIRITESYISTTALSASKETFFKTKLIPDAIAWMQSALSVKPLTSPLLVEPFCSSSYSASGKCASLGTLTCGYKADGTDSPVPSSMLSAKETCSTCYTDGTCAGCSTSAAGPGAANTDFLLYNEYKDVGAFIVRKGDLALSVIVFTVCALVTIFLILVRRRMGNEELGGAQTFKYACAGFLVFLWLVYVVVSCFATYGFISLG